MPALFTLIYVGGLACHSAVAAWSDSQSPSGCPAIPEDLPKEVRKRLGSTSTNRGLRALRWLFVLLAFGLLVFTFTGPLRLEQNEKFQDLSYKDLRVRRLV
jgi:hypothetical protein